MIFWLRGILTFGCSVGSVYFLFNKYWMVALSLHVLGAFLSLVSRTFGSGSDIPPGLFQKISAFFIPCAGSIFAWTYTAGAIPGESTTVANEFTHYINANERLNGYRLPSIQFGFQPDPDNLQPMTDVLNSNATIAEKRLAIESLSRLENPRAVQLLRKALANPSVEVRFYAASSLSGLEDRLASRLNLLAEDVTTARRRDPDAERELAESYFDYAYYGVAQGSRKNHYLQKALEHADNAIANGAQSRALLTSGRALLELDRCKEAEETFDKFIEETGPGMQGMLWKAEACFRLGKYKHLKVFCQRILKTGNISETIKPAIEMWTN